MKQAIKERVGPFIPAPECVVCGETEGTKVFNLISGVYERQVMIWCPRCAEQVKAELNRAFPEQLPTWLTQMRKLSNKNREEAE